MPTKKKSGRPTKYKGIDGKIVGKLTEAFKNDFTIEEACSYAGINKSTYYDWIEKHPEFSDAMDSAKSFVFIAAKKVINKAIAKGDLKAAQWLLERRQKKYYGKDIQSYLHQPPRGLTKEEQALIDEAIEQNL